MSDKTRRGFLTIAATGVAAVAGCAGGSPEDSADGTATPDSGGSSESGGSSGSDESESDSEQTDEETETEDVTGGTLRLGNEGKIEALDPVIKGAGGINQWGESLLSYENGKLPPKPALATDYEIIDGGQSYRFTLKEGVSFHDGSEVTASDFVYCWERLAQSPKTQNNDDIIGGTFTIAHEKDTSGEETELSDYVPGSLAVRAPEKYVFEFDMQQPYHGSLFQIASESSFIVYPENTVGDIEREDVETDGEYDYQVAFGTDGEGPTVAGTGPFQVDTWSKGDRLVMTRFEDYHGEVANIDVIEETILNDREAVYQRALNGKVDIFGIPSSKFDLDNRSEMEDIGDGRQVGTYQMSNGEEVNHAQIGNLGTDSIIFNCNIVPLPVRQAFMAMLNLDDIAENIYPNWEPAYTYTPPQMYPNLGEFDTPAEAREAHYTEGAMAQTEFGSDGYVWGVGESLMGEARQLVQDAGLEGEEYTFTVSKEPEWDRLAQRVQQKANAIGINVTIEKADYGTLISQGVFERNLDFYSLGDTAEVPAPDNMLRFYPPQTASGQASQWGTQDDDGSWETDVQQAAADAWAQNYEGNKGEGEQKARDRAKAYLTIEEAIWQAVQIIPTAHRTTRTFWSKDLDYEPPGVMGDKQMNTISIDRD